MTTKRTKIDRDDRRARSAAKFLSLAFLVGIYATGRTPSAEGGAAPATAQAPPPQEEGYLLDGTLLEDTLIGAPIDAAWEARRDIGKAAVGALIGGI